MTLSKLFESTKQYMFKEYSKGLGQMLLVTGTLGWILSAAGQLWGIKANKNLSEDQKKFLLPQEAADAVVNIISFYVVTKSIKDLSKSFVSSGKLFTKEMGQICKKNNIEIGKTKDIGKAILQKVSELKSTSKIAEIRKMPIDTKSLEVEANDLQKLYDEKYAPFEGGIETLGSIVGAVVSSNIITPIIRNPIAAQRQKQAIALERYQEQENAKKQTNNAITPLNPVLPAQNKMDKNDSKPIVINTPRITTSGSMKV